MLLFMQYSGIKMIPFYIGNSMYFDKYNVATMNDLIYTLQSFEDLLMNTTSLCFSTYYIKIHYLLKPLIVDKTYFSDQIDKHISIKTVIPKYTCTDISSCE